MTTREELTEQVNVVAEARAKSAEMHDKKEESYRQWAVANKDTIEGVVTTGATVAVAEKSLRDMAVAFYNDTGAQDKSPVPGVGIRVETRLKYDADEALRWGIEHSLAVNPVTLDQRAFEKIAMASPIAFVTVLHEPRATIATNLQPVLEESREG